ncbi:protein kinase 4-like, partial [Phymastichus coffea]|uniref:protein kinase 4-like n=1 Tax=Phymastichus coffea TaxID=108790 RepID=UPI00273B7A14
MEMDNILEDMDIGNSGDESRNLFIDMHKKIENLIKINKQQQQQIDEMKLNREKEKLQQVTVNKFNEVEQQTMEQTNSEQQEGSTKENDSGQKNIYMTYQQWQKKHNLPINPTNNRGIRGGDINKRKFFRQRYAQGSSATIRNVAAYTVAMANAAA